MRQEGEAVMPSSIRCNGPNNNLVFIMLITISMQYFACITNQTRKLKCAWDPVQCSSDSLFPRPGSFTGAQRWFPSQLALWIPSDRGLRHCRKQKAHPLARGRVAERTSPWKTLWFLRKMLTLLRLRLGDGNKKEKTECYFSLLVLLQ